MKKGNKGRISQYRNHYGLHFIFADRVFNKMSERYDLPLKRIKDFTKLYYLQKYVIKSNVIVITDLSAVAISFGYNELTVNSVKITLRLFHEKGLIEYYGKRYHLGNPTTQLISAYSYWMHFYVSNFHEMVEGRRTLLKERDKKIKKRT